jgi:ABC-2 type transport system permease protein
VVVTTPATAAVLACARLGWQRLWRDPVGLAFTFLAPIAVGAVMVGAYTSQAPNAAIPLGVVVEAEGAEGPVTRDLVAELEADPLVTVRRFEDRRAMERAVLRRDVTAGLVIPRAVDEDASGTAHVELVGPPEVAVPGGVRTAVEAATAATAARLQLGRTLAPDGNAESILALGAYTLGSDTPTPHERPDRSAAPAAAAILGTLVLFVTVNSMGAAGGLVELRQLGILARARTTRAPPWSVAAGLALGLAVYALVEAVLILVGGRVVFGASWASWPGVLVVVAALALVSAGLGVVMATLLPSPESGVTIAGPIGFLLAMVGGCLWPLDMVGPTLDRLGHLTPQAWAVEALWATGIDGDGLAAVAVHLVILLVAAAGLLAVGTWRTTGLTEPA